MASNNKETIESLLTCIICHDSFDDPRLMPCSHTYCYKCIKEMASADNDQIECPRRDGCKILTKDIDSLPLDQDILDFIELYCKYSVLSQEKISNRSF